MMFLRSAVKGSGSSGSMGFLRNGYMETTASSSCVVSRDVSFLLRCWRRLDASFIQSVSIFVRLPISPKAEEGSGASV